MTRYIQNPAIVHGDAGNDIIYGGLGRDLLLGGPGEGGFTQGSGRQPDQGSSLTHRVGVSSIHCDTNPKRQRGPVVGLIDHPTV